ncbi:MAG TPA: hypothetical protein VM686_03835 [Polyangiaceae bacterium]|jgi:hypothetical protein|nr:hypothetical protein [Polyangiaceae bacterium]
MARAPKPKPPSKTGRRASSTGRSNPMVDQDNWRVKVQQSRLKFDDEQKKIYLRELAEHSRKGDAANAAGVCMNLVRSHIANDPEFEAAVAKALDRYRDKIVAHHQRLTLEGYTKPILGGQFKDVVVAEEKIYPIQLLAMELRKVDHAYRDKETASRPDIGGVLVAPAEASSAEDWAARYGADTAKKPDNA